MADFEELKITVSLVDQASAKIKESNTQLERVAKDTSKKISETFKTSTDTVTQFATSLRGLASAFGLFGNLPIFRLGAGAGLIGGATAIISSLKMMNDSLGQFSKGLLELRDVSRSIGLLPDQFKNISNQLKLIGYSSEAAANEIVSFFHTVEEAARPGTGAFQRIWSQSFNPEVTMARINQMRDLIKNGQPGRAIATAAQEARAIYERELHSGRGTQEARRQAENWLASIGLSMRAMGITDISDFLGDPGKWQRRIEAAERFNVEYEKFNKVIGGIISQIKEDLLPVFRDLNENLSKGLPKSPGGTFETDLNDFRKFIAILEGDWKKLASLLPVGGLLRNLLQGTTGAAGEVQGPPTPFGAPPVDPYPAPPPGTGLTPEQADRNRRRFRRRSQEETQKENEALKRSVQENDSLLEQIKRLNDILFKNDAEQTAKKLGPPFHNAPQGGARGESNPMQLPRWLSEKQPGGGSAAEAKQFPSVMYKGTEHPSSPQSYLATDSTIYYTGPVGSKAVTYTDPATGKSYTDRTPPIGPPSSGLPSDIPGIAFGYRNLPAQGRETLGGYYLVTPTAGPNAGQSFILPHSDMGPGAGTGNKLDYNAPASSMVYGNFSPTGSTHATYIGKNLPENIDIGPVSADDVLGRRYLLGDAHSAAVRDRADKDRAGPGPEEGAGKGFRLEPGGGSFGGGGATGDELIKAKPSQAQRARDALLDVNRYLSAQAEANDPRRIQRALERVEPGSDEEWELRRQAALKQGSGLSLNDIPEGYGPGSGLPGHKEIETYIGREGRRGGDTDESVRQREEYYSNPSWRQRYIPEFNPYTGENVGTAQPISLDRSMIDRATAAEDSVDASADLNVNVRGPAGVKTQVSGEGMFKGNTSVSNQVDL